MKRNLVIRNYFTAKNIKPVFVRVDVVSDTETHKSQNCTNDAAVKQVQRSKETWIAVPVSKNIQTDLKRRLKSMIKAVCTSFVWKAMFEESYHNFDKNLS